MPLVPAEVDLRSFPFMPLYVQQLRDSKIASIATGDEFRAAVLLWCASWHQVPAASLPDDDIDLAKLSGYGRDLAGWQAVRDRALHGWLKCSDGRFYHPIIADLAMDSWSKKRLAIESGQRGAEARWGKKGGGNQPPNNPHGAPRNGEGNRGGTNHDTPPSEVANSPPNAGGTTSHKKASTRGIAPPNSPPIEGGSGGGAGPAAQGSANSEPAHNEGSSDTIPAKSVLHQGLDRGGMGAPPNPQRGLNGNDLKRDEGQEGKERHEKTSPIAACGESGVSQGLFQEGGQTSDSGEPASIKKKKTARPQDFGISQRVREWAEKHGYGQLEAHLDYFILQADKGGYRYSDWDAALMSAIRDDWAGLGTKDKKGAAGAHSGFDTRDYLKGGGFVQDL